MISAELIKQKARQVGFDLCGIAQARAIPQLIDTLSNWLREGKHADMHFMEEHVEMRCNPQLLVSGARSVVSLAVGYKPDKLMEGHLKIAQYAYGEDYHEKLKRMMFALMASIKEDYPDFEAKPCVDTVPISDKRWAQQAGLGWIGKNSLLVTESYGSYVNLAELVTSMEFDVYDEPMSDRCGECDRCVKACPNHAISEKIVDARRCNAYNTIENKAEVPSEIDLRGYVFGCDCCQLVCPFNQQAQPRVYITQESLGDLRQLVSADQAAFKKATKHKALNRIKYSQWQRNIYSAQSPMETERLRLRRWAVEDAEVLFSYASDPELGLSAGWAPHQSLDESRQVIDEVLTNDWTWAIELKENERLVGAISYYTQSRSNIPIEPTDAEVGYWIGREYWKQGIATEALSLMLRVLRRMNFHTVWADYLVGNLASGRVLEKCGFEDTGEINHLSHLVGGDCNRVKIYRLNLLEDQTNKN